MAKKRKLNIVVVTDSLGIPRSEPLCLGPDIIWSYRLNGVSYVHGRTGYTLVDVLEDASSHIKACKPDIIIMQIGIVDCAPRIFSRRVLNMIKQIPLLRSVVFWFVNKYRSHILKLRKTQYVPIQKFRNTASELKLKFNNSTIFAVSILPACDEYEKLLPGISQEIRRYNEVLSEHFEYIDPYLGFAPEELCSNDYHHLNEAGHNLVLKAVNEAISQKFI